jgi:hypothetical protein
MTAIIDRYIPDSEIEACAARLLQEYGRQRHPISAPPVPIEEIVDYTVNIPLIWDAIPDHGGDPVLAKLTICGQPQPEIAIVVNEDKQLFFEQHAGTEQFTLAHEVGHYILHVNRANLHTRLLPGTAEQPIVLCRAGTSERRERKEWQADRFAAYLLMPQDLLRNACTGIDLCQWSNLYYLKEQFQVSISALKRRLIELRLISVAGDRILLPYQQKDNAQLRSLWE